MKGTRVLQLREDNLETPDPFGRERLDTRRRHLKDAFGIVANVDTVVQTGANFIKCKREDKVVW